MRCHCGHQFPERLRLRLDRNGVRQVPERHEGLKSDATIILAAMYVGALNLGRQSIGFPMSVAVRGQGVEVDLSDAHPTGAFESFEGRRHVLKRSLRPSCQADARPLDRCATAISQLNDCHQPLRLFGVKRHRASCSTGIVNQVGHPKSDFGRLTNDCHFSTACYLLPLSQNTLLERMRYTRMGSCDGKAAAANFRNVSHPGQFLALAWRREPLDPQAGAQACPPRSGAGRETIR